MARSQEVVDEGNGELHGKNVPREEDLAEERGDSSECLCEGNTSLEGIAPGIAEHLL